MKTPKENAPAATEALIVQVPVAPLQSVRTAAVSRLVDSQAPVNFRGAERSLPDGLIAAAHGPKLHLVIDLERPSCDIRPEVSNGDGERFEVALAHGLDDSGLVGRLLGLVPPNELFSEDGLFRMPGFGARVSRLRQRG